jgi:heme exporter protein C
MYFAYLVLRSAVDDDQKRAKVSAIYNIFAFPTMFVLLYILPKLTDSLHPGSGGNATFKDLDLQNNLRLIFYISVVGWILISIWLLQIKKNLHKLINSNYND